MSPVVDYTIWHWIFLVNAPVGILAVARAVWKLPAGCVSAQRRRLDGLGPVQLAGCLVRLLTSPTQQSSGVNRSWNTHLPPPW